MQLLVVDVALAVSVVVSLAAAKLEEVMIFFGLAKTSDVLVARFAVEHVECAAAADEGAADDVGEAGEGCDAESAGTAEEL